MTDFFDLAVGLARQARDQFNHDQFNIAPLMVSPRVHTTERRERLASIRRSIIEACADAAVLITEAETVHEALQVRETIAELIPLLRAQDDTAIEYAVKLSKR